MVGPEDWMDRLDYDDYVRLLRQVDDLVAAFDQHPDEATRERVVALLTSIDLLHRSALARLVARLRARGDGPALDAAADDRVVRTLLALYDLAELEVPEELDEGTGPDRGPSAGGWGEPGVAFVPRDRLTLRRRAGGEP
jgi:hypothetical protein